jgi:anti-sigma regulatory factor (Ser/Thr protein kinase)
MIPGLTLGVPRAEEAFLHEALFYAGESDFVDRTAPFIRDAIRMDEPILVVVGAAKIRMLRSELGGEADRVRFADMAEVGLNPARIIPAWREFVSESAPSGRRLRGIGEPIWAERSLEELVECERHEALLNVAFASTPAWWLVCSYDTQALDPSVLEQAERNHPFVLEGRSRRHSAAYRDPDAVEIPFDHPLPEPRSRPAAMNFEAVPLTDVRAFVSRFAAAHGLGKSKTHDLVLAANEVVTNSLRHGGGRGILRMWPGEGVLVCEIRDGGRIDDPMVGRIRPTDPQESGLGLWLVNQLCDLVQVRSFQTGAVVRLHMSPA